ncbi:MAG: ATP synthase F1 subunit delta [Planctomycetota bacterium]|nr:MAG: ATP synthase F1 subunit delta [Planctomycetota bacterium]
MASVAKRYSDALFLAAEGEKVVDAVEADMALLRIALEQRELRVFLSDPNRSLEEKKGLLQRLLQAEYEVAAEEVAAEAEADAEPSKQKRAAQACTLRFLDLVFAKGRALELQQIAASFHARVLESRGEVEGQVLSFMELSDDELRSLEEALGARLGQKLRLKSEVDEELLGGVRIFVKGRLFDASLQGQLEELGRKLRGAPLPKLGS